MSPEPLPVVSIGDSLPYADGAEAELLELFRTVGDRRVGSDELAAAIRDWPTAYHLAPERAALLAPLAIGPRDRVLDVGAGSGVNTRICADRGATVTAVEGSMARAELIAHRCAGLSRVEVLCGPLDGLGDDRHGVYDVALVVGVLEYAGTGRGGGGGTAELLNGVVDALAPDGVVVLAIENRLGLKYLLGFPEDHLGLPWVGWEGYRVGEPTTWSRRELAQMLANAGLDAQKWLFPFPDYKLPTVVLSEEIYQQPDAADMVDQFVGHPTSSEYGRPVLVADDRAAHRTMVTAGLGPDVANSFLVVAARNPKAVAGRVYESALAWRMVPDRRRRWTQQTVVVRSEDGLAVRRRLLAEDRSGDFENWLGQVEVSEEPYFAGRNLEQCLMDCAREGDTDEMAVQLRAWRAVLAAHEFAVDAVAEPHPYLPADTVRALPPEWLDAGPDNFVLAAGGLKFVDREWVAAGGVDVRLAVVRGLWKTVSAMLSARCHLPWPVTWSNDRLIAHLGGLIGENIDAELLERWRLAEADLIARVYRQPATRLVELNYAGGRSRMDLLRSAMAPYRRMEHEVHRLRDQVSELSDPHEMAAAHELARARLAGAEAELAETQARLAGAEAELAETQARLAGAGAELAETQARLAGAGAELAGVQSQLVQAEEEQDRVQAELAQAQARLARVAWRERVHNMFAAMLGRFLKR